MKKIKVVWICHLSSSQIRANLKFAKWTPISLFRRLLGKYSFSDFASWNIKAIREFEAFDDIELHIVAPHRGIYGIQEFVMNGVVYHFFKSEEDSLMELFRGRLNLGIKTSYEKNTKIISNLINKVSPDIIHLIGAENPNYAESVLSLPKGIPLIVTLQTLMNDSDFLKNYPISQESYIYRAKVEEAVLNRADFIGTKVAHFRKIIKERILNNATFLDLNLAVGEEIVIENYEKSYDFVYFAADISKAVDYALEAFILVKQKYPNVTLHVVGGYTDNLMQYLQKRMDEGGVKDGVDFTGHLTSYDDVIKEIRKARFAVLPLKIDLISGTVRESMANGLPVITTITPVTPDLNNKRESVLLSEKGDFGAMAENMCKLLSDSELASQLQQNAIVTLNERYNNKVTIQEWRKAYMKICADNNVRDCNE